MSAKNTPGPWQVNHHDRTQVCDASDILGCAPVAWIARRHPRGRTEDYANARLIAAAPELLLALEMLLQWHTSTADEDEEYSAVRDARAAIAKATGSETC